MPVIKRSARPLPTIAKMIDSLLTEEFCTPSRKGNSLWNSSMPAVNIKETEDQFELELAAPGLEKSDFNIQIDQDLLTISSEKKKKAEKEETVAEKFTRREFSYSSFKRSFNLPETVATDKIQANYKDGILSLVIPKKEEAKPQPVRNISIG